ncbi:MAG: neuromedin U [Phycisphaerae bacterium]|nr:neuromedin U [Phycisphaerae bacterium]
MPEPSSGAGTETSTEKLAKAAQNPVANLISVPFQYNANFGFGIDNDVQSVLNIQPVIPFEISPEWNVITRTILPIIYQPSVAPTVSDEFGLGDTTFTAFASPSKTEGFIWGAGPAFLLPTATDDALGTGKWGAGPSFVGLVISGPWVAGALINNIWSFAGDSDRADVNQMTLQPFVNYNLPDGWYLTTSPIITANWEADSDNRWTIPIGGGVGKIFRVGKLPLNTSLQGYYNVESPDVGPEWQLRFQIQLLFPR